MTARGRGARALWAGLAGAILAGGVPAGCTPVPVEDSSRPGLPEKTPDWVRPTRILVASQLPEDANQDGLIDTIPVTVYLFDERYPLAVAWDGAFEFRVSVPGGESLASWTYDQAQTRRAARKMRPGPGYVFRLEMPDGGRTVREPTPAELTVTFRPSSGGGEIKSQAATSFRLGKAGV